MEVFATSSAFIISYVRADGSFAVNLLIPPGNVQVLKNVHAQGQWHCMKLWLWFVNTNRETTSPGCRA